MWDIYKRLLTALLFLFLSGACSSNPLVMVGVLDRPTQGAVWKDYLLVGESGSSTLKVFDLKNKNFLTVPVLEVFTLELELDGPPERMVVSGDTLLLTYPGERGFRIIFLETLLDEDPLVKSRWIETRDHPLVDRRFEDTGFFVSGLQSGMLSQIDSEGNQLDDPVLLPCEASDLRSGEAFIAILCSNKKDIYLIDLSTKEEHQISLLYSIVGIFSGGGILVADTTAQRFYMIDPLQARVMDPHPFNQLLDEGIPLYSRISSMSVLENRTLTIDDVDYTSPIALSTLEGELLFIDTTRYDLIYEEDSSSLISEPEYSPDDSDYPRIDPDYSVDAGAEKGILYDPYSLTDYSMSLVYEGTLPGTWHLTGRLNQGVLEIYGDLTGMGIREGDRIVLERDTDCGLKKGDSLPIVGVETSSLLVDNTEALQCGGIDLLFHISVTEEFLIWTDRFGQIGRVRPGSIFEWILEDPENPVLAFRITKGQKTPQEGYTISFTLSDGQKPHLLQTQDYTISFVDYYSMDENTGSLLMILPVINGIGILDRPESTSSDDLKVYYY